MGIIVSILIAVFAYNRGQKNHEELLSYLKKGKDDDLKEFIKLNMNDITERNFEKLSKVRQKLIHQGNIKLAEEVNGILTGKYKLPEASFIILNSYIESEQLYKAIMDNTLIPSS